MLRAVLAGPPSRGGARPPASPASPPPPPLPRARPPARASGLPGLPTGPSRPPPPCPPRPRPPLRAPPARRRQVDLLSASADEKGARIDLELTARDHRLLGLRARAPDGGSRPRDELGQLEWLRHVVVGAELEAHDDVDGLAFRREHDDWDSALGPNLSADLVAVEV